MARTPEKIAFSERLKLALTRCPTKIDTAAKLAIEFNLLHDDPVTDQSTQKWLSGYNRPSPDKIETLAKLCCVSAQWLRYGIGDQSPKPCVNVSSLGKATDKDAVMDADLDFLKRVKRLTAHQRFILDELVKQLSMDKEIWVEPS